MKKMIKLLSIGALTSITSLQVIACSDDSQYKIFLSDISNSKNKSTAIFGFLGSADDTLSKGLFDAFQFWQQGSDQVPTFQQWKESSDINSAMNKLKISDIELKEYQGPPHQSAQSISDFWNDKKISWQRDIFKWILNNLTSKTFKNPLGVNKVIPIDTTHKDSNNNIMFNALPIVFCIVNGELYTAGQGWIDSEKETPGTKIDKMKDFIVKNILLRSTN